MRGRNCHAKSGNAMNASNVKEGNASQTMPRMRGTECHKTKGNAEDAEEGNASQRMPRMRGRKYAMKRMARQTKPNQNASQGMLRMRDKECQKKNGKAKIGEKKRNRITADVKANHFH